jgi:glucokinase
LITPLALSKAALSGDGYALSVWKEVGTVLGRAVGDLIYVFNPDAIVFTGGVAQAGDLILKPLWKKLEERPFKTPVRAVTIKVASQASHIGVIGAALL